MNIKDIEKIIAILQDSDVSEFELEQDGTTIRVARGPSGEVVQQVVTAPSPVAVASSVAPQTHSEPSVASEVALSDPAEDAGLTKVESPIVGTFYRKPSPDSDAFVDVGSEVKKGDTLCIVEAMKLMNEIESPADGIIEKILLEDGRIVEYGEVLFLIRPKA